MITLINMPNFTFEVTSVGNEIRVIEPTERFLGTFKTKYNYELHNDTQLINVMLYIKEQVNLTSPEYNKIESKLSNALRSTLETLYEIKDKDLLLTTILLRLNKLEREVDSIPLPSWQV